MIWMCALYVSVYFDIGVINTYRYSKLTFFFSNEVAYLSNEYYKAVCA